MKILLYTVFPSLNFFIGKTCIIIPSQPEPLHCRYHILLVTRLTEYHIDQALTITIKIMIDFKSFLSHMTGKLIAFFNNLATRRITFIGTSSTLETVELRLN